MNRLGSLKPSDLDDEAKAFYDTIYTYLSARYNGGRPPLRNIRLDGVMLGPFGVHLHTPAVGQHFHGLGSEVEKLPGFSKRNREIAILTTTARFKAAYAVHAHEIMSKAQGITPQEVATIFSGKVPETLDEEGKAVWDATYELVNAPGPLSEEKWERLVQLFSRDGAKHFVHLVGFYSYLNVVLNGFDAKVPDD